jgi:pimeloyl-ACP methyl ester carboxylesterase
VVLIDGLTPGAAPDVARRLASYQSLDWLAPTGLLRPISGLFADPAYAPELRAEMRALRGQAHVLRQMTAEGSLAATSGAAQLAAAALPGEIPLLVIAAGANGLPEETIFHQGLQRLAREHAGAEYHEIPGASHYVIAGHPVELAEILGDWLTR